MSDEQEEIRENRLCEANGGSCTPQVTYVKSNHFFKIGIESHRHMYLYKKLGNGLNDSLLMFTHVY